MDYLTRPVYYLEDSDIDENGLLKNEFNPKNLPVFILIQTLWCGHCKVAKPKFFEFAKNNENKVLCFSIQADSNNPEVRKLLANSEKMSKIAPNLKGFPTYIFQYKGQNMEYNSGRNTEDLQKFLNNLS